MQRRGQTEEHGGEHGGDRDEGEHGGVDANVGSARDRRRGQQRRAAGAPGGQGQAGGGAECAQQQTLGEQLADEGPPLGAQRRAHGELAGAAGAGGQQQVGKVGAGDEQDEADGGGEHDQAAAGAGDHRLVQRRDLHRLLVVGGRELLLEPRGDGHEVGARLRDGGGGAEPADGADEVSAAVGVGWIECERDEDVGGPVGILFEVPVAGRQHADHGKGLGVDADLAADHRGGAGETSIPVAVADERHLRGAGPVLVVTEEPPQLRLQAERREEALRHPHHADPLGVALGPADRGRADEPVGAHLTQRAGVAGEVEKVGRGEIVDLVQVGLEADHADQLVGRRVGQRRQQHRTHHAEHRGVGADAQGQRADGDQREAGAGEQTADGEAEILRHAAIDGPASTRVVVSCRVHDRLRVAPLEGPLSRAESLVELTFAASDSGCLVTVCHSRFARDDERGAHAVGWADTFDRLGARLSP